MQLRIEGGRIIDPGNFDGIADILIESGKIALRARLDRNSVRVAGAARQQRGDSACVGEAADEAIILRTYAGTRMWLKLGRLSLIWISWAARS